MRSTTAHAARRVAPPPQNAAGAGGIAIPTAPGNQGRGESEAFAAKSLGREVDKLEIDHVGRVSWTRAELHDPRVAAGTLGEARADVCEQAMDDLLRAQVRERLPPRMEVAAFAERDHLLGERLDRLRLRFRRLDPAVLDQRAREVRVQRLPMRRIAAELLSRAMVTHRTTPVLRRRRCRRGG